MSLWGHLEERCGGEPRPRKLLALDGGGVRGVLTLEVLVRMEELLAAATEIAGGDNVTLLALWDGEAGDGLGGTSDTVRSAGERGAKSITLDTNTIFGT